MLISLCHMHSRIMHFVASVCNVLKTFLPLINHCQSQSAGCSQVLYEPSVLWIKCWICLSIDVMWSPVTPYYNKHVHSTDNSEVVISTTHQHDHKHRKT